MNIMLNQVCNLACPYCFANEFVGRSEKSLKLDKSQITLENYKTALDFAVRSREERIGLIGGEPTLHPKFEEIVSMTLDTHVPSVHLFTNGVYLDKYFNLFGSPRFSALININSPEDIGEKQYQRMLNNIDYIVTKMYAKDKISVGVNIYKEDMNFDFILDVIKKYGFKRLRLAITVPNDDEKRGENSVEYFKRMKETTFGLFQELDKIGCLPSFDCNGMVSCVPNAIEKEWLNNFRKYENSHGKTNIYSHHRCRPVIDVLPNLDVVRCFGMSEVLKVKLTNFENMGQVRGYFEHEIDSLMNVIPATKECIACVYKNTNECMGGCLAFKLKDFSKLKGIIRNEFFNEENKNEEVVVNG